MQKPEPMFLMVSRLTYLPLVTEKVTKHLNRYIANEHQDEVRIPIYSCCPIPNHLDIVHRSGSRATEGP